MSVSGNNDIKKITAFAAFSFVVLSVLIFRDSSLRLLKILSLCFRGVLVVAVCFVHVRR